jgi:zinc transporter, ZIP family
VLVLVAVLVVASLALGAVAAAVLKLPPRIAATLAAFGGGILFAAVALELLPAADVAAGPVLTAVGLLAGAALFLGADAWLSRDAQMAMTRRSGHAAAAGAPMPISHHPSAVMRGEAIAAGIVVDGIPESVALGLAVTGGAGGLALLAAVVLGNLTEAYGAAQPLLAGGRSRRFALGLIIAIGVGLAGMTVLGGTVGAAAHPALIGTAQAVAAGAVVAVLTVSVIPYAFDEVDRAAAVAITLGLMTGYLLG